MTSPARSDSSVPNEGSTRIEIARGALATEEHLIETLRARFEESRENPALLSEPVRVVVPSGSLRAHVCERLVARFGAVLGVTVQTLHTLAIEILDRAGSPATGGDALVDLLIRRRAKKEKLLVSECDGFVDGLRSVVPPARDLLDAGFEPELTDGLLERLDEAPLPHRQRRRARAIVSVAASVSADLAARQSGGRAELLRRAREAFELAPDACLPTRLLVVHGFADATGVATDLLEALARHLRARFLFDHPPDPDAPDDLERTDLGVVFTERLLERIRGGAREIVRVAPPVADAPNDGPGSAASDPITPTTARFVAPGATAEAREVARRVRTLLDDGVAPERIGIVARELVSYRTPLRSQLERLGVPFSALRTRGPLDEAARRIHALVELLGKGDLSTCDRWLDAVSRLSSKRSSAAGSQDVSPDLRLGLRVAGAAHLADARALRPDEHLSASDRLRLPVRTGAYVPDPEASGETGVDRRRSGSFVLGRRTLHGDDLRGAVQAARRVAKRLERWPARAAIERHLEEFEHLRRSELGWRVRDAAEKRLSPALARLAESVSGEQLSFEEFALIAERALLPASFPALGGEGAGVQVLDAMEARARTFEHLFLLGLNQGSFPRVINDDPLLPDDVRRNLLDVLPDMPIKARSRAEERYLFAQLMSSSSNVTLSWQSADDDGKARVVSPLVERLLGETDATRVAHAPPLHSTPRPGGQGDPRTAHEHAILAGLEGTREDFEPRLQLALSEAGAVPDTAPLAAARSRIIAAYESTPFRARALAPWLGFLGAQDEVGVRPDPRSEPLYVTRLEAMARCPWQTVLSKLLRLEEAPDPLKRLPGIDPRTLGNIVHSALQRLDEAELGADEIDLAAAAAREPSNAPWPARERLAEIVRECAYAEARKKHAPLPGLVRMLAECAQPFVERAGAFFAAEAEQNASTEKDGTSGVVGAEVRGSARVPGADVELVFRADRVEKHGTRLVLSDYKTGAVTTDRSFKAKGIPSGSHLQAMAYVLAGLEHAPAALGRYLYLGAAADGKDEVEVSLGDDHAEHLDDFSHAVSSVVDAWTAGTFFPRLIDQATDSEPPACRTCDVREACLIGDSGARGALVEWATGEAADRDAPDRAAQDALRGLFQLADAKRAKKASR